MVGALELRGFGASGFAGPVSAYSRYSFVVGICAWLCCYLFILDVEINVFIRVCVCL